MASAGNNTTSVWGIADRRHDLLLGFAANTGCIYVRFYNRYTGWPKLIYTDKKKKQI